MDLNKKISYPFKHKNPRHTEQLKAANLGVLADITLTNEFTFTITQPHSMLLWKRTS